MPSPVFRIALLVALVAWQGPVAADDEPFEGVLVSKAVSMGREMTTRLFVGRTGVRSEVHMPGPPVGIDLVHVIDFAHPEVGYQLNEAKRTFVALDLAAESRAAPPVDFRVTRLADERVQGVPCRHALAVAPGRGEFEVWTNRDILDYDRVASALASGPLAQDGLTPALRKAGVEGFVVKMVQRAQDRVLLTLELEKIERRALDPALFRVPPGYRPAAGPHSE